LGAERATVGRGAFAAFKRTLMTLFALFAVRPRSGALALAAFIGRCARVRCGLAAARAFALTASFFTFGFDFGFALAIYRVPRR
jgi:hypothetical protein